MTMRAFGSIDNTLASTRSARTTSNATRTKPIAAVASALLALIALAGCGYFADPLPSIEQAVVESHSSITKADAGTTMDGFANNLGVAVWVDTNTASQDQLRAILTAIANTSQKFDDYVSVYVVGPSGEPLDLYDASVALGFDESDGSPPMTQFRWAAESLREQFGDSK